MDKQPIASMKPGTVIFTGDSGLNQYQVIDNRLPNRSTGYRDSHLEKPMSNLIGLARLDGRQVFVVETDFGSFSVMDTFEKSQSIRQQLAQEFIEFFQANEMCSPYGAHCELSPDSRYRMVMFCVPNLYEGEVRIFGQKFFLVVWNSVHPLEGTDETSGAFCYHTVEDALSFIELAFVVGDMKRALAVPRRNN